MMCLFYSSSINNCGNFPLYFECDYCPKPACRSVNMYSQIVTHICQDGRVVMCRVMPWQVCITPYKMRIFSQNGMPTRQVISHYTLWTCMCLLFKKIGVMYKSCRNNSGVLWLKEFPAGCKLVVCLPCYSSTLRHIKIRAHHAASFGKWFSVLQFVNILCTLKVTCVCASA